MKIISKNQVVSAFSSRLIDIEIAAARLDRLRGESDGDVASYFTSTPRRRLFGLVLVRDALGENEGVSPSYIAKEVGCSRNAVDTIIAETDAYNFIRIDRDANGRRTIYCGQVMLKSYMSYCEWRMRSACQSGIPDLYSAYRLAQ